MVSVRVRKVSFDFLFKIKMKIEKIVNFDFCLNIEFWILTKKSNFWYQFLDRQTKFEIIYF